jgi:hypothetical protein
LVFVVKYRRKALSGAALDRMQEVCLGVAEKDGLPVDGAERRSGQLS